MFAVRVFGQPQQIRNVGNGKGLPVEGKKFLDGDPAWVKHGRMTSGSDRRFALVYLVHVFEVYRGGLRPARRGASRILPGACAAVGIGWTGRIDQGWILSELAKVRAEPDEYDAESYERWRLLGLPIWAALAAGMTPTPGSRKIIGRRPCLP